MIECPNCKSKKIFRFSINYYDSDIDGDYYAVNDNSNYTKEEYEYDVKDIPNIDMYHCRECDNLFQYRSMLDEKEQGEY